MYWKTYLPVLATLPLCHGFREEEFRDTIYIEREEMRAPRSFAIGGVARPLWVLGPVVLFSVLGGFPPLGFSGSGFRFFAVFVASCGVVPPFFLRERERGIRCWTVLGRGTCKKKEKSS